MSERLPRVLILHAYSADNAGDGLLVRETLALIQDAVGEADITLLASRPDSFAELVPNVHPTVPTIRGWRSDTRAILRQIDNYDLVVGVGGGYLRSGTLIEALKAGLVMGPQLRAAARSSAPTVYLPQSIGPARFGTRAWVRSQLEKIDLVMVRDDRSLAEMSGRSIVRMPDLATAAIAEGRPDRTDVDPTPVVSIRAVHGKVNPDIYVLASRLGTYDGYIQSTIGGNDDRPASATLDPRLVISRSELMTPGARPRVVVAVRLHAALMALAAGHYVVHLAYERKGFGAFGDLGIDPWVHTVNGFDVETVFDQTIKLLEDGDARADYNRRLAESSGALAEARGRISRELATRIRRD